MAGSFTVSVMIPTRDLKLELDIRTYTNVVNQLRVQLGFLQSGLRLEHGQCGTLY
jgi:hypothetical protein